MTESLASSITSLQSIVGELSGEVTAKITDSSNQVRSDLSTSITDLSESIDGKLATYATKVNLESEVQSLTDSINHFKDSLSDYEISGGETPEGSWEKYLSGKLVQRGVVDYGKLSLLNNTNQGIYTTETPNSQLSL